MGNLKFTAALVLSSALLTACQGQNPFQRESNPVKKYPHTMESGNQPYIPGQKTAAPKGAGANGGVVAVEKVPCFEPVKVEVEGSTANSALKFVEDTEGSYNLKVTVNGPQAAKDQIIVDGPENSNSLVIARQDNSVTYKFTWKPAKGQSAQTPAENLIIGFEGVPAAGACANAKNRVTLDLAVSKNGNAPTVTFVDNKEKIKFGAKFDFKVIVEDKAAGKGKAPSLMPAQFTEAKGSQILDGSEAAVGCDESKIISETKYEFVCHFDSNLIKEVDKLALPNSGKEVTASFSIIALSKANVPSAPTSLKVKVLFAKIETKSTPLPPPRPVEFSALGAKK